MKRLGLVMGWMLMLLAGCHRDISGTYLMSDQNSVVWLQIVRTPDNRLAGQLAYSVLGQDGNVDQNSYPIEGAVNAEYVTLSFNGKTFGGSLDSDNLTLTGRDPAPLKFVRTNMNDYQKQLAELKARSQSLLAAKQAEANREKNAQMLRSTIAEIDKLIERMTRFDSQANIHLGKFPDAEKHLREITAKINGYVSQERELANKPNTSVERSQLVVAEYQAALDTNQMHLDIQSLVSSVAADTKPLADETLRYENICSLPLVPGTLTASQAEQRNEACKYLSGADSIFREKYTALSNGLSHLEMVYQLENNAQQDLIHTGEKLQK